MDPLDTITDEVSNYLTECHVEAQSKVKQWIGENIMNLSPPEVDRAMRVVKSIERMSRHLDDGIGTLMSDGSVVMAPATDE